MSTRTYETKYTVDHAQAIQGIDAMIARLTTLETLCNRVKPLLASVTAGVAQTMNNTAAAADKLTAAVAAMAGSSQAGMQSMQALATMFGTLQTEANAAAAAMLAATAAAGAMPQPTGGAASSVETLGNKLIMLRAGMFVLHEVKAGLDAVADAAEGAAKHMNTGAEKGLQMRDSAREYANLRGADGPDDQVMGELFELQRAGGLTFKDAVKFGEQFRGSAPAGLQKGNVGDGKRAGETQAEYEKRVDPIVQGIAAEGAKFATRVGLDPSTGGDLSGMIAQYGKTPDVETASGQLAGLAYGLNEGRGKISTLARGALGAASSLINGEDGAVGARPGRVKDLTEIGAIAGVASVSSKTAAAAGTMVKQSDRLLNRMAASDDAEVKALGISFDDSYVEALRKAEPILSKPGAKEWLLKHGLTASTENDAGIAMARNLGTLDQRIAKGRDIAADGKGAMAQNAAFRDTTIAGSNRMGEVDKEQGEYVQTMQRQRLAAARKTAEGQLQAEQKIDTNWSNITDTAFDAFTFVGKGISSVVNDEEWKNSRQQTIDSRAIDNLREAGKKAGIDVDARFPRLRMGEDIDAAYNALGPEIEAKGIRLGQGSEGIAVQAKGGIKANPKDVPAGRALPPTGGGGKAGGAGAGGGGAGAGGQPTASIDASDLKDAARALMTAADALRDSAGGGDDPGGYQPNFAPVEPGRA